MDAHTENLSNDHHVADTSNDLQPMGSALDKERWSQKYAVRMLSRYLPWQTPLGIASEYLIQLRQDLVAFYDDPLKRIFIETSY